MNNKQKQLDELSAQITKDNICPVLAEQATQLVFGSGSPDADMVFIGEAPGKSEDLKGEPFIGAAGKFLNEMLETIGLKRAEIYITNIVKYRPSNNRDPLPTEKSAFLLYLEKQIDIINPKLIITLGRHSMDVLLPSTPSCDSCLAGAPPEQCKALQSGAHRKDDVAVATASAEHNPLQSNVRSGGASSRLDVRACSTPLIISQVHGALQNYRGRKLFPLYHPAAALYNGGLRQTLLDDFANIPTILKKIN